MKYANLDKFWLKRIFSIWEDIELGKNHIKLYLIDLSGSKCCSISLSMIKAAFKVEKVQNVC